MREMGYAVQIADFTHFIGNDSIVERVSAGSAALTMSGEKLSDLLIQQTIIYPFKSVNAINTLINIQNLVSYMSTPEAISSGDTFTMVYLCFLHQPFIVDANGHEIEGIHAADWDDPQYYLGQYQYATKIMIQMLENILTNDENSIILLQSDHGARGNKAATWEFMTSPLNALYYQGNEHINIEGLSPVNTIRLALNQLLGTDFEMLELSEYSE